MRGLICLILCCFALVSQAQEYSASAEIKLILSGVDGLTTVGSYTVVNTGAKPTTEAMGVVKIVTPPGGTTSVKASDITRTDVMLEPLEDAQTWLLRNSKGKVWIDSVSTWLEWPEGQANGTPKVKQEVRSFLLELAPAPVPVPVPVPPGPGPVPPGPGPGPGPVPGPPIPGPGLKVLMIYEQDESKVYPPATYSILYGKATRTWLNSNSVNYRILDQHAEGENSVWLTAIKRPRTELPWIIISNATTGYEGPLPATEAATLELIGKYK